MVPDRLVFLFPGQGSQSVGMGKDLYEGSPAAREILDQAQRASGFDLLGLCFEGPAEDLARTEFQQPSTLAVSVAAHAALSERLSLRPAFAIGHSLGEYSALVVAGVLSLSDAVRVTRKRGAFMQEAVPEGEGAMAALLGASPAVAEEVCKKTGGQVWIANFNGGGQVVLTGKREDVERARSVSKTLGVRRTVLLPVTAPFHSPLMEPAAKRLREELSALDFSAFSFPVIANVDAAENEDPGRVEDLLVRQATGRVLFEQSLDRALESGAGGFLEIGPGGKLAGLVRRGRPEVPCLTASTLEEIDALAGEWR